MTFIKDEKMKSKNNKIHSSFAALVLTFTVTPTYADELPEPATNQDYYYDGAPSRNLINLGQSLFFDKIMSGNKNISCATCHNPLLAGTDGLSLGVGEGGEGLGRYRTTGEGADAVESRIGRHAPHLYNLGAKEFEKLNWNGIHQVDANLPEGLNLPSGLTTPSGLNDVLAGQSLFPIVNLNEMLGDAGENEIVALVTQDDDRFPRLWNGYVDRLKAIPEYVSLFMAAFDDVDSEDDIGIEHYANAVSAFQGFAFRSDNSAFDQYLRGNTAAMTDKQISGMELFYGEAGCSTCHSGTFQTDHEFHGIAMPQVGPGAEAAFPFEDRGRAEATGSAEDWAKFRTPSLRNVWITAPYGHSGAYGTLRKIVEHHLDPINSLENYNSNQLVLPKNEVLDATDLDGYNDATLRQTIIDANDLEPVELTRAEISDLLEFLRALTDWNVLNQEWMIPDSVPSGLPVRD